MEFRRTGSDDFSDRLKIMISGPPKSGKTTFLGSVPNIVIADTEPHANNLASIAHLNLSYVTVESTQDLRDLHINLASDAQRAKVAESLGMPSIDAVAIDTLDTLQQMMKKERMKEKRQTQFLRDDWGWLKEEMTAIIRAYTSLPLHVIFTVHIKTQELGTHDDGRTIVLPGLQGAIAEEIAGMVGFSMYAFRQQEIQPDGSPRTKYWLRAEGDETFTFVGNRAAGRLPDVIEPSFEAVYDAAMGGRPAPIAPQAAPVAVQQVAPAAPPDDSDEPVNAAALSHLKKVYDAVGLPWKDSEPILSSKLTMGQARQLIRFWRAALADEAEGKCVAVDEMLNWITANELNPGGSLDINATIETIIAWVDLDTSGVRAQEAYDLESAKPKFRKALLSALVARGAMAPTTAPADPIPEVEVIGPPESEPMPTPEPDHASQPMAVEQVAAKLGATVLTDTEDAPCEECGNPVDDQDIAVLARSRFGRWLCVTHYINANTNAK